LKIIGLFDVVPHESENWQWELQHQRNIANQMFTVNDANATIQRFEAEVVKISHGMHGKNHGLTSTSQHLELK